MQFVAFKDLEFDAERLTKEVLAEIPDQLLNYMKAHNVAPKSRGEVKEDD